MEGRAGARLIYPDYFESGARRAMWYLDTLSAHVDWGYIHGVMRTPVVLTTQNMVGNGMVMWAPRRIELLASPSASYSEPWMKQLVAHEYRHNVQYNNLRRGTNKVLTWLLGEQAAFLATGQFSIYVLEGDAVMAETEMSAFGRGLQPSWTMHYRAVGDVGARNRAVDYWFSGSYRDFVPDHYRLGYQMVRWLYNEQSKFVWDDVARYVARNPQWVMPMVIKLRKETGMNQSKLFRRTFADLNRFWDSLPRVEDSSSKIPTPWRSYTTYEWPLWLDGDTIVAFKTDLDRTTRIVRVNASNGVEETLANIGAVSSRPVLAGGVLWWTEYRTSALWDEKVSSVVCSYDFASGRKRVRRSWGELLYPTAVGSGGEMAFIRYSHTGRFSVVSALAKDGFGQLETVYEFPLDTEVTGLAWDNRTHGLYYIGLDDGGMYLAAVPGMSLGYDPQMGIRKITPSRHITISDLRASNGVLFFGSIVSGKDEAHAWDLARGEEFRLSTSRFGSFQPSPSVDGGRIALTTYDRHGYHLAVQALSSAVTQQQRELPLDLVNPPWRRWDGIAKFDSLVYTPVIAGETRQSAPKKYRKFLNIFRPHSWVPADFYPPGAIEEMDLTMRAGATVMSQSLLSDATGWLAVGYGGSAGLDGGAMARGGIKYTGLGPELEIDFTWGGSPQVRYTQLPAGIELKKYFSLTTRLSLPFSVSSGYWSSVVIPSAEWFYTNGLIFKTVDATRGRLTRGVERLSLSLRYVGQTRMAHREFLPRWGFSARAGYVSSPTNGDFFGLWSASVGGYLPGIARPHSLTVRAAVQGADERGGGRFVFRMKELFPRGAGWDFVSRRIVSGSVDYQLPVWYPEGGWRSIVYFKRVRVNLFADFARWEDFGGVGHRVSSFGGDLIFDVSPLRLPASTKASVRVTVARPSDRRGVWLGVGVDMPL